MLVVWQAKESTIKQGGRVLILLILMSEEKRKNVMIMVGIANVRACVLTRDSDNTY